MTSFTGPVLVDGVPVGSGGIPTTFGTTFYVDADNGDDANDGLTMDTAKSTVLAGYNLTTSGSHDIVVMTGNTAHTFTAELAVTKSRVHFWGLGLGSRYLGQRTRWEMASGGSANSAVVYVTGVGCTFTNIKIFNTDSSTSFAVADSGEYTQWTNVEMVNTQNLGTTTDAHLLCNVDSGYYLRCSIGSSQQGHGITGARANVLFTQGVRIANDAVRDTIFEDCIFPHYSASTASLHLYTAADGDIERLLIFKNCIFYTSNASSSQQIDAILFGEAQTVGDLLLDNCTVMGPTSIVNDSLGVFSNSATPTEVGPLAVTTGTA